MSESNLASNSVSADRFRLPPKLAQRIWRSPDVIMLLFVGSAADFALNKAVDWLFFTNALPSAPLDRFFETVQFGQTLAFGDEAAVQAWIARVNGMHRAVEQARNAQIPAWGYRDVLFFGLDYTERGYVVVYGPLTAAERQANFSWWMAVGEALHIENLPRTYAEYQSERAAQLQTDFERSALTDKLYLCYRRALAARWRMWLLYAVQASLVPAPVRQMLGLRKIWIIDRALGLYRYLPGGGNKLRWLHRFLLPRRYTQQLANLTRVPSFAEMAEYPEK